MLPVCLGFFPVTKQKTHSLPAAWYLEDVLVINIKVLVVNANHFLGCSLSYKIPGSGFFCRLFNFSSFILACSVSFCFLLQMRAVNTEMWTFYSFFYRLSKGTS